MKYSLLFITVLFIAAPACLAQNKQALKKWEIFVSAGSFTPTHLQSSSGFTQPISIGFGVAKNFSISKNAQQWFAAGVGMQSLSVITDHYFNPSAGTMQFTPLVGNINYNRLSITQVQLPIVLKQVLFKKNGYGISLNGGLNSVYIITNENQLRGGGVTQKENVLPDNRFQFSPLLEVSTIQLGQSTPTLLWGFGLQYQFTDYLQNAKSFRPLQYHFKIGVSF